MLKVYLVFGRPLIERRVWEDMLPTVHDTFLSQNTHVLFVRERRHPPRASPGAHLALPVPESPDVATGAGPRAELHSKALTLPSNSSMAKCNFTVSSLA